MTTSCAGNNTIAALLAGAVDAAAAERLEIHLDRCSTCRELVAKLGRGLSAIGEHTGTSLPQVGEQIGRYEIRRVVGVGGMGVVYEAHDTTLDRTVAVKLLRPDLHGTSLLSEAQTMARLQHANIVTVFDVGITNGQLYICMEYVAGTTLRTWAAARTWREIAVVYAAAGEGLAYVHRAGLVHLDFKPDNVLVDREGRVRVTDFGLARMLDAPAHRGLLVGTPAYMAPEQRRCEDTDARCDQYAFCASLKEALGDRSYPAWLHRVIARGMSADRADRFAAMPALLAALTAPLAQRRRRLGGVLVIGATAAIALALTMQPQAAARGTVIVERPFIIDRVAPASSPAHGPVRVADARAPLGDTSSPAASPAISSPAYGGFATAQRRRDFAPAFAMLASAAARPSMMRTDRPTPSSDATADSAGFATELGPCDDGTPRTCSYVMPICPVDTVVAVQGGCWTCAETQTCAPLGIPRTCNDGTPLQCKRERPTCEGRRIPAVTGGCWSCEDPFTCQPRSTPTKPPPRPPVCGNRICEYGETCAADCYQGSGGSGGSGSGGGGSGSGSGGGSNSSGSGGAICGNGMCEAGESHASCANDCCETGSSGSCLAVCGNGFCEAGESHASCANDCCEMTGSGACVAVCGNGFCETGEPAACAADCS